MILRLPLNLIPETSFCSNLRSELTPEEWKKLSQLSYRQAEYRCLVCKGKGDAHPVEAHERWTFENGVQRLIRVDALCPACHETTHFGFAQVRGREKEALAHFMNINKVSQKEAITLINASFKEWEERSKQDWILDMTLIKDLPFLSEETRSVIEAYRKGGRRRDTSHVQNLRTKSSLKS